MSVSQIPPGAIEHLSAGEATVSVSNSFAFSKSSRNMRDGEKLLKFGNGNHFFENPWVAGDQSTRGRDGLGPYFNSNACQNCHFNDGRGNAGYAEPDSGELSYDFASLLIRVARSENIDATQQDLIDQSKLVNIGDSLVGRQLQQRAVNYVDTFTSEKPQVIQVQHEVDLAVSYTSKVETFADGFTVRLRIPKWHITNLLGEFDSNNIFSARLSPPMIGLGLLELIDSNDLLAREDMDDTNQDGISGRTNQVWSAESNRVVIGRFGWKAGQASLLEQSAGAFAEDMGLTSRFHQNENCLQQQDCLQAPSGTANTTNDYPDNPDHPYEVIDKTLDDIVFYTHHLAVPKRRNAYADSIQRGKELFMDLGCESCHTQSYVTGVDPDYPELSQQTIFPYTDLLLHNMGEDLADFTHMGQPFNDCKNVHGTPSAPRIEYQATVCEWRTPPLWGLGLSKVVNKKATFLHDGRAETILEAILWHGGEAEQSKQSVLQLNQQQRDDLLAFLNDL